MSVKNTTFMCLVATIAMLFFSHQVVAEVEVQGQEEKPADQRPLSSWEGSDGYAELSAFAEAFPEQVSGPFLRNGNWEVNVDGLWFSWSHARILPEELQSNWADYQSIRFYQYPLGLPPIRIFDADAADALKSRLEDQKVNPPERHEGFLSALYQSPDRRSTESMLEYVEFLGFRLRVHTLAAGPLKRVEQRILELQKADLEVSTFLSDIRTVDGYSWRDIAGTASRSYHSYGMAVDLLPRSFKRQPVYWRWALEAGYDEWWAIPYEDRWMVPMAMVQAFEAEGFIWGGKWLFFDAMHFEYRPEILILTHRYAFTR